jgi:hypothetical protein
MVMAAVIMQCMIPRDAHTMVTMGLHLAGLSPM